MELVGEGSSETKVWWMVHRLAGAAAHPPSRYSARKASSPGSSDNANET